MSNEDMGNCSYHYARENIDVDDSFGIGAGDSVGYDTFEDTEVTSEDVLTL